MAARFYRAGTSPTASGAIPLALAPDPGVADPVDFTILNEDGDSDVLFVGNYKNASVFLSSDSTCAADLLTSVAPTAGGPWIASVPGGGAVPSSNPSLAAPIMVAVVASPGRCEYVKVTTSNYVSGNPRAFLVGQKY